MNILKNSSSCPKWNQWEHGCDGTNWWYGSISTIYTTTMGYYVIKFISEAYTLQEEEKCDVKILPAGKIVVKV